MARRTRADMEETRATLLATARKVFSECGYATTSMDDLTAQASLTRGALYHHFGDKKGLLAAVVEHIDAEMDARLVSIANAAQDPWEGFCSRCRAYLAMAVEPEYQRIVLRDAKSVLGGSSPQSQQHCIQSMQHQLAALISQGTVVPVDAEVLASLIYGSLAEAAFWIADGEDAEQRLGQGITALEFLLRGLRVRP